jgi:lipoprotein-anchoring transpeptidase ErfK/SrfK
MKRRRLLLVGGGRSASVLRLVGCAFGVGLLLVGAGSGAKVMLSEESRSVGYSAGLGYRQLTGDAVSGRLATSAVRCIAPASRIGSFRVAYAALVKHEVVARKEPQRRSPVAGRFGRLDENGFRQVLAVIGVHAGARCVPDWFRVELPVLPNGTTGWVRVSAVQTYRVRSRIVVDLGQRRLRLFRSGKLVFETRVSVGSSATPTPLGRYFVNERYVVGDARGPFGPDALGISAHSAVLQHVWVEDGPIGIHGTNEPWSIGHAASHGCIRVANAVMLRLFPLAPAGTPVIVNA